MLTTEKKKGLGRMSLRFFHVSCTKQVWSEKLTCSNIILLLSVIFAEWLTDNSWLVKYKLHTNNHQLLTRLSKISWFVSAEQINYFPKPKASARHWQTTLYFAIAEFNNCFIIRSPSLFFNLIFIHNSRMGSAHSQKYFKVSATKW